MLRRNFLKNLGLFSASAVVPTTGLLAKNASDKPAAVNVSGRLKCNPIAHAVISDCR